MRPWLHHFFSLVWDTGTPIFSGATSISPPLLPFPLQLSYSKTAIYIPPVKSVKSRQPASQPEGQAATEDVLLCFSSAWKETQQTTAPFLSPMAHCYSLFATGRHLLQLPLNSNLSAHQTKCQEGRLLSEINKPCSNTYTPQTGSSEILEQ